MKFLLLVALVGLVLAAPQKPKMPNKLDGEKVTNVELKKVESLRQKLIKTGKINEYKQELTKQKALKEAGSELADTQLLSTEQYMDSEFVLDVTVGEPGQVFTLLFSIMDPSLWVLDSSCGARDDVCESTRYNYCSRIHAICVLEPDCRTKDHDCCSQSLNTAYYNSSGCAGHRTFDHTRSYTYQNVQNGQLRFDFSSSSSHTLKGFIGEDYVTLNSFNAYQQIELVTQLGSFFQNVQADGVIGFGLPKTYSRSLMVRPFFLHTVDHYESQDTLGMYLGKYNYEVTFGGVDQRYYVGDVTYVDSARTDLWSFSISSASVYGQQVGSSGIAVPSTTHNFIGMPSYDIQRLLKHFSFLSYDQTYDRYNVNCNAHYPDVAFLVRGNQGSYAQTFTLTLTPQDYVIRNGYQCYLAFRENGADTPSGVSYVLGTPFFNAYYHIFEYNSVNGHMPKIGFAKAAYHY